ncbi:unnamed protein product [Microthlaspi erraticum]|uniref:EF-hand domain-containing protein n=1 Tax=Microthlaspi erraticum TaxID=1685480 RepID=A0A6D2K235_9BRAS|nr:unnamed protein product [Microthlaspi erraticum]
MDQDLNQTSRTSSSPRKRRLRRSRSVPRGGDSVSNDQNIKINAAADINGDEVVGSAVPLFTKIDLEVADINGDGVVGAAEFMVYRLKQMNKIDQEDIIKITKEFERLDVDESGTLTDSDIDLAQTNSHIQSSVIPRFTKIDLEAADLEGEGVVGVAEFLVYRLKEMDKIDQEDIIGIMEEFEKLDLDESGTLTTSDIVLAHQNT